MVTHDAQSAVRPQQQFALQTLPQHVRLAHDHAMQLNNSSSSSDDDDSNDDDSNDDSVDNESDSESNQLDAHEPFRVVTSRKPQLVAQHNKSAAVWSLWQRVREQHDANAATESKAAAATGSHNREQQQQREEHDGDDDDDDALAVHVRQRHQPRQRQALERKNSARSSPDTTPFTQQSDASSDATPLYQQQQQRSSGRAFTLSPLHPVTASIAHNATDQPRRKPSAAAPITEAVIQDEIRTMLTQTEQLLSGAQQAFSDVQQQQSQVAQSPIQPHPPQPAPLLTSGPLRSSRLTVSDIMSRASATQQQESSTNNRDEAELVELLPDQNGELAHDDADDNTEGEDNEDDSIFSDDSSSQDDEGVQELSDGEMYPSSSSNLLPEQQSILQQSRYMQQQNQAGIGYQSAIRTSDDENDVDEEDRDEEEQVSATNRDINASKARALKESMVGNLMRLGFKENLTRLALDAGVQEIDHYDSDCELAYVDIFMSLVKMVCDAHLDSFSHRPPHHHHEAASAAWMSPAESAFSLSGFASFNGSDSAAPGSGRSHQTSSLPFKWPVFDMAQFEFGNARAGTCFDSVCVLTNLPKVSMDRTEELMEILSCNLFCMIGDPIQVVIPSVSATGRTKGHAFLEFDDHHMAKACAAAIDGLTWGRGPFGRIRSSMFRQYQVKSPTAPQMRFDGLTPRNESSSLSLGARGALDVSTSSSTDPNDSVHTGFSRFDDEDQVIEGGDGGFSSPIRLMMNPFADDGSESGDAPFSPLFGSHRSLDPFPDDPFTSSEEDDDEDEGDMLWRADEREMHLTYQNPRFAPRDISIDDVDVDAFDDQNVIIRSHPFAGSRQLSGGRGLFAVNDSQLSSDAEDEDGFGSGFGDHNDDTWGRNVALELQAAGDSCNSRGEQIVRGFPVVLQARPQPNNGISLRGNAHLQTTSTEQTCAGAKAQSPYQQRDLSTMMATDETEEEATQTDESEKPWRSYCEELIARNREMQEQVAYARRRIVQLGHNNQKLHLLVDRVERDRDGLVFENDLLQTQLNGFEDHERHHEALMTELTILRKRLRKKERSLKGPQSSHSNGLYSTHRRDDYGFRQQHEEEDNGHGSASLEDVRFVLHHQLGSNALTAKSVDELKDWEQLLESSLVRVRSMKEEKALALQKKLDRQVEEQQELKLCVICLSNEKSILCLPCRHLCLCESCSAREEVEKCPICRLHIDEMLLVYA